MVRIGVTRGRDVKPVSHRPCGPEIAAEKAEEKIWEESKKEDRIVSGVRTKIDKRK